MHMYKIFFYYIHMCSYRIYSFIVDVCVFYGSFPMAFIIFCYGSRIFLFQIFFCLRCRFPLSNLRFSTLYTMILQCIRIIVGDDGFEPGISDPEIWCATNEPPHLRNEPPHLHIYCTVDYVFSSFTFIKNTRFCKSYRYGYMYCTRLYFLMHHIVLYIII